ncbi:hypothetical protein HOD08_04400, partial [bacterium]|nr:hypothetical protein [bacterium]
MKTLGEFQKFIFFLAVAALLCASSSLVAADADFAFADAAVADAPPPAS